ncbi:unnamed protein product [Leptidea sinapis]|uniref:Myotubularin phosphatase domain-containing protein n=1 Tax=Leptidea sinapis TaxID=189913 RepID=A0A5E4QMN9_9NEOP|nr:unnamed protein product [Leptidea sinapis]
MSDTDIVQTPKLENVQLLDKYNLRNPSRGTLYFATTHLIFVDHEMRKETWILLTHISMNIEELYCFNYKSSPDDLPRSAGWNFFNIQTEYQRMNINAMVNRAAGKGYENEAFYENMKFQFLGIGNIHVMRKSLQKLVETCEQNSPTMSSFLSGLESSGWLKHIKAILDTSWWIACAIQSGVSVCVHCSDGWDRTAQVCSLAALCLEPHYRTINGYQALIEKDWLSFGHKFTSRCGHVAGDPRERSPVFTQLLDCTWQLLRQVPEVVGAHFLAVGLHGEPPQRIQEPAIQSQSTSRCSEARFTRAEHKRITTFKKLLSGKKVEKERESSVVVNYQNGNLASVEIETRTAQLSIDNKFNYESGANLSEVECANDDHPLKEAAPVKPNHIPLITERTDASIPPSLAALEEEMNSVAVDWKSIKNVTECSCSTPLDHFSRKVN